VRTNRRGGEDVRRLSEPIPFEMGLQIPSSVRAQAAAKSAFWASSSSSGRSLPCSGPAEGVLDSGRASAAGPRAYVYRDSPQASGGFGDRVAQGEERYCHCPTVWQRTQLRREHFWARGYAVSTVGFELEQIRQYIRDQEDADGSRESW
jgi:hypothetical protein